MKICVAGQGAFGIKHIEAIRNIPGIEVVTLAGGGPDSTRKWRRSSASRTGRPTSASASRSPASRRRSWRRRRRCTPKQAHAVHARRQARADRDPDGRLAGRRRDDRRACRRKPASWRWPGHTRRFNPSHQWVHKKIVAGELKMQQMDVQTYFFRRTNMNALGKPRSWTDHLLWHHACHTVDLFQYQTGETASQRRTRCRGRMHPELKIAMDMSIQHEGAVGRHLHAVAVVQQRRPARHVLPLHLRQRHLHRALRRPGRRQEQADRRVEGRRVDERHRAAGPRVLRGDQGGARAERERRAGAAGDADARQAGTDALVEAQGRGRVFRPAWSVRSTPRPSAETSARASASTRRWRARRWRHPSR